MTTSPDSLVKGSETALKLPRQGPLPAQPHPLPRLRYHKRLILTHRRQTAALYLSNSFG